MNRRRTTIVWWLAAMLLVLVQRSLGGAAYIPCEPGTGGDLKTDSESFLLVVVDCGQKMQTIDNFAASDAWSAQFVGRFWPEAKRNAIADLLFSTDLDEKHDPKGIGLSGWRFNVGAGSNRQGYIYESWHQTDTFLSADWTSYDWTAQAGQRWFLQAAKARGAEQFVAFVNSPPINMTKNGRAYCFSSSGSTNLASDKIDDFAEYLATIIQHFRDVERIEFKCISPFNEPNWDWNGNSQEGCRYYTSDIKQVVDALYDQLQHRGLATQIMVPEAASFANLYEPAGERTGHIEAFLTQNSQWYIGDKIAPQLAGHGYFACWPEWDDRLVGWRETLRKKLDRYPGATYWMTEYCMLIPNESWVPPQHRDYGLGRDLGMGPALWISRLLHYDMTVGCAAGWQWWLGISAVDYKDGLVYIDENKYDGNYYESKMLWAMGNFSRFIRPGMQRVAVDRSDKATPRACVYDLMVSAYTQQDANVTVVVCVNWDEQAKVIQLSFLGADVGRVIPYVTRGEDLQVDNLTAYAELSAHDSVAIPARSVVTLVGLPARRPGDLNADFCVDFRDIRLLAGQWLDVAAPADVANATDDAVDFVDFANFARFWLRQWNRPPVVTVTTPHDGAVVGIVPGQSVTLEAEAQDADGSVRQVQFFVNGSTIRLDDDASDGWKASWPKPAYGSYIITARATDDKGLSANSPAARVTLRIPGRQ